MADDDANEAEEEEEGGGGKKKLIMGVVAVAALGGVYNFVLKSPPPEEGMESPEAMAAEVEPVEGEILEMEEMILNIGNGDQSGYLRIGLALVLEEGIATADFEAEAAIAKDVAIQYLSSLSNEQLRSNEGRQQAKEELSALVREAYGDEKVVRVLFTALVMQ
jgi:flagellar basal body-associated protein FliL